MPNATVTIRELKNKNTGIDLSIPSHKEIAGLISNTVEYHIVVVSHLPCFKSAAHKEGDVVQFMIPKHFEDFEELRRQLMIKYSGIQLPPLPRKGFNVLGDSHANEKRFALETFLNYIAQSPKLVHSTITLEFLGVNAVTANSFTVKSNSGALSANDAPNETSVKKSQSTNLFGDNDEEEEDLFGSRGVENTRPTEVKYSAQLFESTVTPMDPEGNTKLFEDQDYGGAMSREEGEAFLFPEGATEDDNAEITLEDNSDILNIEDDLDSILKSPPKQNKKPEIARKPVLPAKPAVPAKPKKPSTKPASSDVQDSSKLDASDIFKYIADNEKEQSEDLDLFS